MRRRRRSGAGLSEFCFLLILLIGLVPEVAAQSSLDEQIKKQSQELERLQSQIRHNLDRSRKARIHEKSVLSELQDIEDRIRVHEKKLNLLQLKIRSKDIEIERIEKERNVLKHDIQLRSGAILRMIRTLYKEGIGKNLNVLFSAKDFRDFENRIYFIKLDARRQQSLLEHYKGQMEILINKNEELDRARLDLNQQKSEVAQELSGIRDEQRSKRHLLASIQNERSTYDKAATELDEASQQLQQLLKELREKKSTRYELKGFARQKGRLIWPNPGEVVALFGKQKHPKFDTYIFRKGIEIRPDPAEEVRAIYNGKVIYADWFRGYGMVIILDHGDNYYSLYAHLAKLLVSVGDHVTKNRVIGMIGETGLVQDSRLYFEIRYQGEPMDPLAWLEKRRQGGRR